MFHLRDSLVVSVGGNSHLFSSNDIISSFNTSFLGRNAQCFGFDNRFPLLSDRSINFRCYMKANRLLMIFKLMPNLTYSLLRCSRHICRCHLRGVRHCRHHFQSRQRLHQWELQHLQLRGSLRHWFHQPHRLKVNELDKKNLKF